MVIATTGRWEIDEVLNFDPPAPMGPLGKRSQKGTIIRHNRELLKKLQRGK